MKFREIVESPCGIRYLFDELRLQSGYARRVLLDTEMMTDPVQIGKAYASLASYVEMIDSDPRRVEDIRFRLQYLRDISATLSSLSSGAVLDEIEMFEVKHLAMLALRLDMGENMESVVEILDPDGLGIATFYLYDSYSPELRRLRSALERSPEDESLRDELMAEEQRLRSLISGRLRPCSEELKRTLSLLADLDIKLAMALQVRDEGLCIPTSGTDTRIVGMFHPGVRSILRSRGGEFQNIDFDFSKGTPVTVIGANMGGKTVALKSICMIQYLYQFGFGVPATEAMMVPFDEIFFSLGDRQDEASGLSSFAAEMLLINRAIVSADSGSKVLMLVDEPARTTNPVEGTALVEALLSRLAGKPDLALLMTTHYTVSHSGICWRVRGLIPDSGGRKMDYFLVKTADHEVPREALGIARELGIDSRWIELADKIMKDKYEK